MNAIIYARFSDRPDKAECESLEAQTERARAYCTACAYTVAAEYQDAAISGKRAENRPGLQAALIDVCRLKGVLVVYSLSRLARSTKDAIEIADRLEKCGAELASLKEKIDTTSPSGRLFYTIISAVNEFERANGAERTSDIMRRHQASGRRMSDREPYGWRRKTDDPALLELEPAEQTVIQLIKGKAVQGVGLRAICRWLQSENITCRGADRWHHTTVAQILRRKEA